MSAIIILTIGPVQSYISQARRTQDLWQGSRILSYLASAGVHHALEQQDNTLAEVIYPSIDRGQTDNIPNRIVVRWLGDDDGARDCAKAMENAIRKALQILSANTLRYFNAGLEAPEEQETVMRIWQEQEKNWLECYWVVIPYNQDRPTKPDQTPYAANVEAANAALGARKLLRNFPQIDERGRKCSITGEHEALHSGGDYVAFWNKRKAEQRNLALLGKHERLSAISTIKRFAHEPAAGNHELQFRKRFPSTSSIAAASFRYDVLHALDRADIDTTNLRHKLQGFVQTLLRLFKKRSDLFFMQEGQTNPEYFGLIEGTISEGTLGDELVQQFRSIDGDFLFEDTLISKTIEEYSGQIPNHRQIGEVRQALLELLRAAKALNIPRPQPYFVILSMDGDSMGKTLGVLTDADRHKLFSETLANFARIDVPRIVEQEHLGRLVYAGGDDVLALLPVRDALQVAEKLRSEFEGVVAGIDVKNHNGERVTASTGLAYVHHTHNLQDAIRAANAAQSVAKDSYGRNALGVEFLRRSGEPRSMGHKWIAVHLPLIEHLSAIVAEFQDGLSHNLPYDFAQITYSMGDVTVPYDARHAELNRVIRRRLREDKKHLSAHLSERVLSLTAVSHLDLHRRWHNAQGWLELARFIAQTGGV